MAIRGEQPAARELYLRFPLLLSEFRLVQIQPDLEN